MAKFSVTYDIVTYESAENGDCEDCGFVVEDVSLREALQHVYPNENCGSWWSESDARIDYRTGEHETRSLHPPRNITPASYGRISRLLRA